MNNIEKYAMINLRVAADKAKQAFNDLDVIEEVQRTLPYTELEDSLIEVKKIIAIIISTTE